MKNYEDMNLADYCGLLAKTREDMPFENKKYFIKDFCGLLKKTRAYSDLSDLDYAVNEYGEELLIVRYRNATKTINITGDSCFAIIIDFVNKIERTEWDINGGRYNEK